jgi:hypothetical protein
MFLIFLIFIFSGCYFKGGKIYDEELIIKGTYPYQTFSLREGEYENIISSLRKKIEKEPEIFDKIVKRHFDISYSPFKYHITMIDRERKNLVIKYFSRFLKHEIYAGISIQFIYSLKDKKIIKIYVDLIPLE